MGHESQIELWSPFDRRSGLLVSELTGFVAIKQWKPLVEETQKRWATTSQQPSTWRGRSEQILFIHMGCEVRKIPAAGEIFFLTSPLQKLRLLSRRNLEELESKLGGFRLEVFDL